MVFFVLEQLSVIKPNLLAGGYGQFTFHFNYWGPTAVNRDTHVIITKMKNVVFNSDEG